MALNCTQLGGELERVSARKVELYNQLKKTADNDAAQMTVGLLILWPTLFFLEGGDGPQAAEYSRLLGEEETIQKMMVQKNCGEELIKAKQFVPGTAGVDIRLQKLQELLDAGTISQDEFDDQRSRILKEI